jgi:HK97 family phage portal protein
MKIIEKAVSWLARKAVLRLTDPAGWYTSQGYHRLAALHGEFSENSALQLSAVTACLKILGEDVGSLPLNTFERSEDGRSQEKVRTHPLYRLLHDSPNPETTAIEFREGMTATAALCGHSFARIERASRDKGRIIALWRVQNHHLRTDKDSRERLVYIWKDPDDKEKTLQPEDVLHLRGFSLDGESGLSFLKTARRVLRLARDQEEYAQKFFTNDHTPGIVLVHPGKPGPEGIAGIKKAWKDNVDSHDVAVTQEGLKPERLGSTNTDAQLIEQRNFALLEVCRFFRMPPHKLADLSRANFTNIENENNGYYTNTLRPWLVRWEQAINLRCISVAERSRFFVEHSIEGFLRGDFKTQSEGFAKLLEKGVWSVNEVRAFMGANPVEGGDQRFIQLNMQNLINAANGEPVEEIDAATNQPAKVAGTRLFRVKGLQ